VEGRELDCIQVGTGSLTCWIIHRQHPGESMAEHYAEGLLTRLLGLDGAAESDDDTEATSRALSLYTFYIVPCMCPDGAVRGHLRTNAVGANLNREWTTKGDYIAPTLERSPEVYWTLKELDKTGVDCFVDVHGDEELPYNFLSGSNCIPKWSSRLEALHGAFCAAYSRTNSDMQQQYGYPPSESTADVLPYMNVATNQVSNRFECLAVTLEMPFKDCQSNPDPDLGWNPKRSRQLGASVVDALLYVQPYLRVDSDFWMATLTADDAYVVTTNDYQGNGNDGDANDLDDGFKMIKKRFYSDVHEIRKVQQ
jgi:murein tripeptide amidase MpaA